MRQSPREQNCNWRPVETAVRTYVCTYGTYVCMYICNHSIHSDRESVIFLQAYVFPTDVIMKQNNKQEGKLNQS